MSILTTLAQNKLRIITGVSLSLIALFCIVCGGFPLTIFVGTVIISGAVEFVNILKNKGFLPCLPIILFVDMIFLMLATLQRFDLVSVVLTFATILSFLYVLFKGKQPYIANVATTILGFIYTAWLPAHVILIRQLNADSISLLGNHFDDGLSFVILLFLAVLMTDIGGYYFGSKFGKRPLAAVISPKKTIEGSIGGTCSAIVFAVITGYIIGLNPLQSALSGLFISVAAQFGDLSESLLKRDAGVKDSGSSLPGHGGFLDRADSFIFAAPVAYYIFKYFILSDVLQNNFVSFIVKVKDVVGF